MYLIVLMSGLCFDKGKSHRMDGMTGEIELRVFQKKWWTDSVTCLGRRETKKEIRNEEIRE